ncbi:hypothetical protein GGR57DRAFT_290019 [Xylariaceae sp. FL1272]|nr:hypothetical protein GGR57DRAFT_290019 [Xylariaceae sp. FL1272]
MSAERSWDKRQFRVEESTTLNGGARTVFIETMAPGPSVPPHWHNDFSETFDLQSGSMKVFKSIEPDVAILETSTQDLEVGKPVTVPIGQYHPYKVGTEETVLRCVVTPANEGFERLLKIMNGLGADGKLQEMTDSVELMAIAMELSMPSSLAPQRKSSTVSYQVSFLLNVSSTRTLTAPLGLK